MSTTWGDPTAAPVAVRVLENQDEPAVVALLRSALGGGPTGDFNEAFYRWKHRRNPFGASPGLVATSGDEVVGVRLFMRWQLAGAAGPVQAVRAVDTATHPGFRGLGIFRRLTMELLDRLDEAGEVDLVFNTPNSSSRPGYLKMGWRDVGTFPVRIAPVRPARLLHGARGALRSTAGGGSAGPDAVSAEHVRPQPFEPAGRLLGDRSDEVADLIRAARKGDGLHTPLSLPYLTWRYGDAPGLDYRCITVEHRGRLVGLGFGRIRQRGQLCEFTLADVLVRDGDRGTARRVLSKARRAGADHVTVHTAAGSEARRAALPAGYLSVPRYGVALVANPRRPVRPDPTNVASWRLSLGDLEVF